MVLDACLCQCFSFPLPGISTPPVNQHSAVRIVVDMNVDELICGFGHLCSDLVFVQPLIIWLSVFSVIGLCVVLQLFG